MTTKEVVSKKPKGASVPLSSDELVRACHNKLFFDCLGSCKHKDCPKLKCNELSISKGKEREMHMVQLLPLEDYSKFANVQVSHQVVMHECKLTPTP